LEIQIILEDSDQLICARLDLILKKSFLRIWKKLYIKDGTESCRGGRGMCCRESLIGLLYRVLTQWSV